MEDQAHDEQHHYAVPLFILFAVAAAVTWIVYQKPRLPLRGLQAVLMALHGSRYNQTLATSRQLA